MEQRLNLSLRHGGERGSVRRDGERVQLTCPGVGHFSRALEPGCALVAGQVAGVLSVLGRVHELVVPDGVAGVVRSARPERVQQPVDFGAVLYELAPLEGAGAAPMHADVHTSASGALVYRAPSSGRFWHRTTPGEPPLVSEGKVIELGAAIGLIEVMKTFTLVQYAAAPGLPVRARILRVLVTDGAEIADREPLIEIEPA